MTGAPPAGIPGPTATAPTHRSRRLPRRWRNLLLATHVVVAVGALGTDVVLLNLAMDLLVTAVLLPLALAALGTGVLLGLGTRWGWPATGGCWPSWP
jgi:hypothetical protein